MQIIIEVIIILIAGWIQGLTSFGFSMLALPFLTKLIPLKEVVPSVVILNFVSNIIILFDCIKDVKIKKIILLIISSILLAPVGAYSLLYINPNYLILLVGIVIIIFSLLLIFKKTFPIKNEKIGYTITGALSGFLNGCVSLSGPPVVLFLSNQEVSKNIFRSNMAFYFLILNFTTIIIYFQNEIIYEVELEKLLYYVPSMLVGVFVGVKLSKKLNDELFRNVTLIILLLSGILTIVFNQQWWFFS